MDNNNMLLLVLAVCLTQLVTPAAAGCSPSHAVVAVVSVVSTLVVIALILLAIYIVLRRRRNQDSYLQTSKVIGPKGDVTDGYVNAGFDNKNDPSLAEEGLITVDSKGNKKGKKKPKTGKDHNAKTWSSFPEREQPGILYRPGSCGSLDENNMHPNSEIVTVCLESQDIIGLGFNISGNFGEGIQVSQVHNRGPAVECGLVKVGDKILSVEVSYENIVYEDALTILSYASPYPVKLTLQKGDARRSRDSALYKNKDISAGSGGDGKLTAAQLNHPLYRSQSLDVFKHLGKSKDASSASTAAPFQPKRTQSEMKPETRKDGSKSRKKGDRNSKSFVHDVLDKISSTISPSKSSSPKHEVVVSDVVVHREGHGDRSGPDTAIQMEDFPPAQKAPPSDDGLDSNSDEFTPSNSFELATLMDDKFDLKNNDGFESVPLHSPVKGSPNLPPSKPERKNKKQGSLDSQNSFDSQNISSESLNVDHDERTSSDVDEDVIVPSAKKSERRIGNDDIILEPLEFRPRVSEKYDDMSEALSPLSNVHILSVNIDRSPSPDDNMIVEDIIEASDAKRDSSAVTLLSTLEKKDSLEEKSQDEVQEKEQEKMKLKASVSEIGTNTETMEEPAEVEEAKEEEKKDTTPAIDEDMLERLIAMNSYEPGTQGWAGIQAGGDQGGIADDFIPQSKEFISQPVTKKNLNASKSLPSSRPMSPPSLAYEIRDDVIRGTPVAVGIRSRSGTRDSSPSSTVSSGKPNKNISNLKENSSNSNTYSGGSGSSNVVNKSYNASKNNNKSNNNNNNRNNNNDSESTTTKDVIDTTQDLTGYRLVNSGSIPIPDGDSDNDFRVSKIVDSQIMNSDSKCVDDLTDSDSECAMPARINFGVSEDRSRRSKMAENSDVSNSFTSSSGEATPPYSSNGQELGSSPEYSVSKSPLDLMSAGMEADSKSSPAISVTLHRQDDHSDVEC